MRLYCLKLLEGERTMYIVPHIFENEFGNPARCLSTWNLLDVTGCFVFIQRPVSALFKHQDGLQFYE